LVGRYHLLDGGTRMRHRLDEGEAATRSEGSRE
jgi:hypothetical protein